MPAQNYNVFISYSRANQDQKKRLLIHLDALAFDGTIGKPWHDRFIGAGDIWRNELETAMNEADVALLLVSADFIASPFCQDVEVPGILERHKNEGVLIVPIIVGHCSWKHIPWLSQFQVLPEDGRAVMSQVPRDKAWTQVIEGLRWRLENKPLQKKARVAEADKSEEEARLFSLTRLLQIMPGESGDLFGRAEALGWLDDAYANSQVSVLALVGFGGVGKSALVRHWLETRFSESDKGLPRFLGVSFYSQGTREQEAGSSDQFLVQSLGLVGEAAVAPKSAWDRGQRLAELLAKQPTVLVLDGLEPLQHGPGPLRIEGQLKDPGIHALLAQLAEHPGKVLAIVSTRVPLTDDDLRSGSFVQKSVEILSPEAARDLMLARGVRGTDREITKAVEYLGRHPLALVMAAEYLQTFAEGDVNRLYEISLLTEKTKEGRHAKSVIAAYEKSLGVAGAPLDVELLSILGLFDRPMKWEWLKALSTPPPIKNLTDHLVNATDRELWESISRLRQWGMIGDPGGVDAPQLDAHPLIREYFGEKLKNQNKAGWSTAHSRIFDYLASATKKLPDTLEEMEPLYQAIAHGCSAGRHEEALYQVYWRRIQRKSDYFSLKTLGAIGADTAALANFFDHLWDRPAQKISDKGQSLLLDQAGESLHALGRLTEASKPMRVLFDTGVSRENWNDAVKGAITLSELSITMGDLSGAVRYGQESVKYADLRQGLFHRQVSRSTLADALHQSGKYDEAAKWFSEAESIEQQRRPEEPLLSSVQGFAYCEFLLTKEAFPEVKGRAEQTLEWANKDGSLLAIALDYLSMGRSHFLQALQERIDDFTEATDYLKRAVDVLRHAGTLHCLPRGLIARAELYRVKNEIDRAWGDLDDAMRIATRSSMRLLQADCRLEYARLYLAMCEKDNGAKIKQEHREKAREHLDAAKEMIERMGYHRRDKDVQEIEAQLNS